MQQISKLISMSIAIAILVLNAAHPASASESDLAFRVAPASGSQLSEGGDYFILSMQPGESREQAVQVSNSSSKDLEIRLAPVDASTAQMGGVDYGSENAAPESTGDWIVLSESKVALAPGESKTVEFSVRVPSGAADGLHLAGLSVWVEGDESQRSTGSPATINLQSRRVIAVQVNLPGPAAPLLEIRSAQAEARPDGLYLGIELFNLGTDFASGEGTISIEGRERGSFLFDKVVPRTGTTFPFKWADTSVPNGSYPVSVEIDYGGPHASWEGEVVVGAVVQNDLRGRGVAEGTAMSVPQKVLIGGIALIVGALLLLGLHQARVRSLFKRSPSRRRLPSVRPVRSRIRGRPTSTPTPAARFVPRPEEVQRRVPPPPPPPPPRPGPARAPVLASSATRARPAVGMTHVL